MPVPPSPPLDETITPGQFDHIADHEAIADALNNDTASLSADNVFAGDALFQGDLNARGLTQNTDSPTYGPWFTFGNTPNSMGFAGTGTPAEAWAARVDYNKFGADNPGADIHHTTQAAATIASYYGPTVDDSMEAASVFVHQAEDGVAYTQSLALTAWEAHAQISGANIHNGGQTHPMIAHGGRISAKDTSHVTFAATFRSTGDKDAGATIDQLVHFHQPAHVGATIEYGVFVVDPVISRKALTLSEDSASGDGFFTTDIAGHSSSFVYAHAPSGSNLAIMRLQHNGDVANAFEIWLAGGSAPAMSVSRFGGIIARGNAHDVQDSSGNGLVRIGQVGLEYLSASLQQATVGAAGAAAALPGAPLGYFKAKNQAGTVVVIPYWAAV